MSLEFRRGPPPADLRSVIRDVWTLRGTASGLSVPEPVLPDGYPELVLNRADPFRRTTTVGIWEDQPRVLLVGPQTTPAWIRPTGAVDLIGIRLEPWALGLISRHPAHELRNEIPALEAVVGRDARALSRAAEGSSDPAEAAFRWLRRRWEEASVRLTGAVHRVASASRRLGIGTEAEVAEAGRSVGLSRRQVERLFREQLGLPPRTWGAIRRFQRAAGLRAGHPDWSWSRIAVVAGYTDQAHLTREFRRYASVTPGRHHPAGASLTDWFLDRELVA